MVTDLVTEFAKQDVDSAAEHFRAPQMDPLQQDIGWRPETIIDLGGIEAARGPEHYMALFWRLFQAFGTLEFNIGMVRK